MMRPADRAAIREAEVRDPAIEVHAVPPFPCTGRERGLARTELEERSPMVCSNCGAQNEAGLRFCNACGTALTAACASCGATNRPGSQFCGGCGARLAVAQGVGERPTPAPAPAPVAERRLVTVLFADLVGFTTLAEGCDAEDTRELLSCYFDLARDVIGRYGGTVEKFIGDAVMAVWGAPVAQEDDAELAVRAALDLMDAVTTLGPSIQARAGS